ncbi:MAG: DUF58 domain-containing protein [Chloroflexota bacterium]
MEFTDYREYAPGDDLRALDWNVYARLERLFIKLFVEEQDVAVHVLLDASASMDGGSRTSWCGPSGRRRRWPTWARLVRPGQRGRARGARRAADT